MKYSKQILIYSNNEGNICFISHIGNKVYLWEFYIIKRTDSADSLASARFYKAQHAYNVTKSMRAHLTLTLTLTFRVTYFATRIQWQVGQQQNIPLQKSYRR